MLTAEDEPIIRRALTRRLESEPGVKILDIKVVPRKRHIAVGVLMHIDDWIIVSSVFDLDLIFEHSTLVNEIDEVAEGCKEARRRMGVPGQLYSPGATSEVFSAKGTGRRSLRGQHLRAPPLIRSQTDA